MASRIHEEYYTTMMQRSIYVRTHVETAGIKCTLTRMHINVRSKVGVVKINFFSLDRRDHAGAFAYIDAHAIAPAHRHPNSAIPDWYTLL